MTIAMLKRLLFKFTFIKSIRFQEFGGLKQKVASLVFIRHTRRSTRRHDLTSCYFSTPSPGKNLCTHSWFSSIKNFVIASYHESNTLRFLSHPKTDCSWEDYPLSALFCFVKAKRENSVLWCCRLESVLNRSRLIYSSSNNAQASVHVSFILPVLSSFITLDEFRTPC